MKTFKVNIDYTTGNRTVPLDVKVRYESIAGYAPTDLDPAGDPGEYRSEIEHIIMYAENGTAVDITDMLSETRKLDILELAESTKV